MPFSDPVLAVAADRILGGWRITRVTGARGGGALLHLVREADEASLQIVVTPRGEPTLARTRLGGVSYKRFSGLPEQEAARTTVEFARLLARGAIPLSLLFPHLALAPEDTPEERRRFAALMATTTRALPGHGDSTGTDLLPQPRLHLRFDPPGLAEFLAPELEVEGPAISGFVLQSIYLPPVGRREAADFTAFVLEFHHEETGEVARLRLGTGEADSQGTAAGPHFRLRVLGHEGEPDALPIALASLQSWLIVLLRLKSGPGLEIEIARQPSDLRALCHPSAGGGSGPLVLAGSDGPSHAPSATPPALNLAVDAECGQACVFCSVKSYVPPQDHGLVELQQLQIQMRQARDAGAEELRLNGIDPLGFSRVLDLVADAREMGFLRLSVFSPCRRLADDAFRTEFLRRAPGDLRITVPLYGIEAATHDAVVGTPGAFLEVSRAIEALRRELPAGHLFLSTVLVRQNVDEFAALVRFARDRGLDLHARTPYPMRQTTRDPYAESVLPESEIVSRVLAQAEGLDDPGLGRTVLRTLSHALTHPCLLFEAERRHRLPALGLREFGRRPVLAGTEYRSQTEFSHAGGGTEAQDNAFAVATVECPHARTCALAPACSTEHYAVYGELFGLAEFHSVSVGALYALPPHEWTQS